MILLRKKNIKKTITSSSSKNNKLSYKLQRELDLLPEKIEKLTLKIHDLGTLLESPHFYNEDPALLTQKSKDFESLTKDLEELENRWLELEELKRFVSIKSLWKSMWISSVIFCYFMHIILQNNFIHI